MASEHNNNNHKHLMMLGQPFLANKNASTQTTLILFSLRPTPEKKIYKKGYENTTPSSPDEMTWFLLELSFSFVLFLQMMIP